MGVYAQAERPEKAHQNQLSCQVRSKIVSMKAVGVSPDSFVVSK